MNHAIEFYRDTYVIQGTKFNGNEKISKKPKNKMYIKKKGKTGEAWKKRKEEEEERRKKASPFVKSRGGREREKKILASRDGANLPRPAAVRSLSFPFPLERLSLSLSVHPSSLSLSFGRAHSTRFPFHPTNPFRPISIFTHRFRVCAIGTNDREKVITSRKKPSKSNDRRVGGRRGGDGYTSLSFSLFSLTKG